MIDPESIMNNYGADAVRLFILSDSPPEKDVQWSEQGMNASYKFLQKLWTLHNKVKVKIQNDLDLKGSEKELENFTNQMISKITNNLENFSYNVIIANIYEIYNFLNKEIEKEIDAKKLKENYIKILVLFSPAIPHFSSECFEDLGYGDKVHWPIANLSFSNRDKIDYVIQINGKKRAILNDSRDIDQESLLLKIKSNKIVSKYIKDKAIDKIIFVKNRLINLLIHE